MLKGAIFDLDGTLLDSMAVWDNIGEAYLRSLGKEPNEDLKKTFETFTLKQAAEYLINNYDIRLSVSEIIDGVNKTVEEYYRTQVVLKKGVAEFLSALNKNGIKMCIATVTDRYLADETLERLGVRGYFSEIFTCAEVGCGKDHPDIYRTALLCLGIAKSEAAVFEDAYYAAKTAKTDGFKVVAVYDEHEAKQEELKALADVYVKVLDKEIINVLGGHNYESSIIHSRQ